MLTILDPTQELLDSAVIRPARPGTLAGKRVGLFSNGKLNADHILAMIAE